jgi:hypothetical protein
VSTTAVAAVIRSTIPARLGRLCWSPFHTSNPSALLIGYLIGGAIMVTGGVVEPIFGIKAEGKSLEDITKPITTTTPAESAA